MSGSRVDRVKRASRALAQERRPGPGRAVCVSLESGLRCETREGSALVVVGEPREAEGRVYPKAVRTLCWELRTAEFLDREGAVLWKRWDEEDEVYSYGVGVLSGDEGFVAKARKSGLTIEEVR